MSLEKKIIALASYTCPHRYEGAMYAESLQKAGWMRGEKHNFVQDTGGDVLWCAHLDTAHYGRPERRNLIRRGDILTDRDGLCWGADDRAGVALIIEMARLGVPGCYYLFSGEEVGCVGSNALADDPAFDFARFKACISLDRRGQTSVITKQLEQRCCSERFALALARELGEGFSPDATGIYSDSASFMGLIPECTNLSVGYENAHSHGESQDLAFLEMLLQKLISLDCSRLWSK